MPEILRGRERLKSGRNQRNQLAAAGEPPSHRWDKPRTDMLTYDDDPKRKAFLAAIERAQEDGLSPVEMASMITAVTETQRPTNGVHSVEPADVIYEPGNLPEGLIDLPTASKKYGIRVDTLRRWVQRGKLPRCGRLRARSPGGGYIVTVEEEILHCRDNPRKSGPKRFVPS